MRMTTTTERFVLRVAPPCSSPRAGHPHRPETAYGTPATGVMPNANRFRPRAALEAGDFGTWILPRRRAGFVT
jgi:hypothetical protein